MGTHLQDKQEQCWSKNDDIDKSRKGKANTSAMKCDSHGEVCSQNVKLIAGVAMNEGECGNGKNNIRTTLNTRQSNTHRSVCKACVEVESSITPMYTTSTLTLICCILTYSGFEAVVYNM